MGNEGQEANGPSFWPSISADGRYVAFSSWAGNLVLGLTDRRSDIFVRDMQLGRTARLSLSATGSEPNGISWGPAISSSGRHVAFTSRATNLIPHDTNDEGDVFVADTETGLIERISVASSGAEANNSSIFPSISGDGRYVAFQSLASNLTPDDHNRRPDVFVRDRATGTTQRADVDPDGTDAHRTALSGPSISETGRFVAFRSLLSLDYYGSFCNDIMVWDRTSGQIEPAPVQVYVGNAITSSVAISRNGRFVIFEAGYMEDPNFKRRTDGPRFRRKLSRTDIAVHDLAKQRTTVIGNSRRTDHSERYLFNCPAISGDGTLVAFNSRFSDLTLGDTNGTFDVFASDWIHLGGTIRVRRRLSFGAVTVGDGSAKTFPITNLSGTETLRVHVQAPSPPFGVVDVVDPIIVPPARRRWVTVEFKPTGRGAARADLEIHSSDPQRPVITVRLRGRGT